jgi:hypothetical protein
MTWECAQRCILLRVVAELGYSIKSVGTLIMLITGCMTRA